jgi:hypothetical protein
MEHDIEAIRRNDVSGPTILMKRDSKTVHSDRDIFGTSLRSRGRCELLKKTRGLSQWAELTVALSKQVKFPKRPSNARYKPLKGKKIAETASFQRDLLVLHPLGA